MAVCLCVGLAAAACGSSSKGGSSTASGTPIKLGLVVDLTGSNTEPWVQQAAEVAIKAVNANGGAAGHPLQLDACDAQSTQTGAALCAQKLLLQDKDLMLVGDPGLEEAGVMPTVQ